MTETIVPHCLFEPIPDRPGYQQCKFCKMVARAAADVFVNGKCSREAPPIEATALDMARSASKAYGELLLGVGGTRDQMLQARCIEVCSLCPYLSEDRCAKCGCKLKKKIQMDRQMCPEGLWNKVLLEHGTRNDVDAVYAWLMVPHYKRQRKLAKKNPQQN